MSVPLCKRVRVIHFCFNTFFCNEFGDSFCADGALAIEAQLSLMLDIAVTICILLKRLTCLARDLI